MELISGLGGAMSQPKARVEDKLLEDSGSWQTGVLLGIALPMIKVLRPKTGLSTQASQRQEDSHI